LRVVGDRSSGGDVFDGGDDFSGFAQPRRCVDEEDAGWSTVGVVTDKESVLLVPVDGGVGDTDLVG
jgi:hypothetical protein